MLTACPSVIEASPIIILLQAISNACDEEMTPFLILIRNRRLSETVVSFCRCYAGTAVYAIHHGSTMRGLRYFAPAVRFCL